MPLVPVVEVRVVVSPSLAVLGVIVASTSIAVFLPPGSVAFPMVVVSAVIVSIILSRLVPTVTRVLEASIVKSNIFGEFVSDIFVMLVSISAAAHALSFCTIPGTARALRC